MTIKDINEIIKVICPNDEDYEKPLISPKYLRQELEQLALEQEHRHLEQEPTTKNDLGVDCVSRQIISDYVESHILEINTGYGDLNRHTNSILRMIVDYVENMPSVTPQDPRWIPVSEKLPKPFTFVNATCRSLVDDREDWVIETVYLPIPKEANKHGYSNWGNIPMLNWGEAEVIAWVERIIPQPYKADRSEEDI